MSKIDSLYEGLSLPQMRSLDYRRGGRSLGHFALMVYDNTVRETFLVRKWAQAKNLLVIDNGLANDGRLIIDTKGQGGKPDFIVQDRNGNSWRLEIKFAPSDKYLTYKVADLENYAKQENLIILTIIAGKGMMGSNGDPHKNIPLRLSPSLRWFTLGPENCRNLLRNGEIGNHNGFGGKPTVRVYPTEFSAFFIEEKVEC